MSAVVAYFTARSIPVYAGRFRFIKSRVIGVAPTSSFRTWSVLKEVSSVGRRLKNVKAMTGGAFLIMAGVAMYPTGKHSLYPGIPIPVTSLNRGEKPAETNYKLIVVDKLDEPKEKLDEKSTLQDILPKEDAALEDIPTEKEKCKEPLDQVRSEPFTQTNTTVESTEIPIPVTTSEIISPDNTDEPQDKLVGEVLEEIDQGESQETEQNKEQDTPEKIQSNLKNVIDNSNEAQTLVIQELSGQECKEEHQEAPIVIPEKIANSSKLETDVKVNKNIPDHVPYLLIGAGTASFAAYRAIKSKDPTAKILIIGEESRLPYMRPPLSKELWYPPLEEVEAEGGEGKKIKKVSSALAIDDVELRFRQWNGRERSLYYEPEQFYTPVSMLEERENGGISVLRGRRVEKVDSEKQIAYLEDGTEIRYDKCLIATGGTPRNLPVLKSHTDLNDKVTLFRKVEDFFRLNEITQNVKSVSIIGGGFLGSELACALGARSRDPDYDLSVTQIYRENGNMAKVLPEYLSVWTTEKVKAEGVNIINNVEVKSAKLDESGKISLSLNDGQTLETDHVIVAIGIEPETQLAKNSGLEIDGTLGGFKVNDKLESRSNIWVAGDAACFYDAQLGRRRVEHHDHAVVSGRLAGENMTGSEKSYTHQSMFWSDLGPDVGYEAIGLVDSKLPTVGVFAAATEKDTPRGIVAKTDESLRSESEAKVPENIDTGKSPSNPPASEENYGKGVIFYLNNDIVVGILMWNVFNKMSIARKVIREHKHYDDLSEVAKLFNIHEKE